MSSVGGVSCDYGSTIRATGDGGDALSSALTSAAM